MQIILGDHGYWEGVSAIGIVLSLIGFALNLLVVQRQVSEARRYGKGQFINTLEQDFDRFTGVYLELRRLDGNHPTVTEPWHERMDFYECLDFFERVETLVDLGLLDIALVDRMFGPQFFALVHHPQVQAGIFARPDALPMVDVYALHAALSAYRRSRGLLVPRAETDLRLFDPARYADALETYTALKGHGMVGGRRR
jgi:hypothetical protein